MSGNTSGALGFVQGLQGGMAHSDQRRRNKAIDNMLDREAHEFDLDVASRKKEWEKSGAAPEDFPAFSNPANKDPFAVRGFNYLKNKFGFGKKDDTPAGLVEDVEGTQDEDAIQPGQSPFNRDGTPFMADGGKVEDEERMKRSYGDSYVTEEEAAANREHRSALPPRYQSPYSPYMREQRGRLTAGRKPIPTDGGGALEFAKDVGRSAASYFDDTVAEATDTQAFDEATARQSEATTARERGAAARGQIAGAGGQMARTVGGLAKDLFVDNPITQGILGFVGFEGTTSDRQPDPYTPPKGMTPKDETPKQQAIQAAVPDDGAQDAAVAQKAIDNAVEVVPGHPDGPDQQFDASEIAASGVTPEDIPPALVEDWSKYRKLSAEAAALRGESVEESQMNITKMQMSGFASNAQQAAFLLRQGDARGAAIAMRIAYQYFPNGSDVRFGIAEGTNGPVLVGMGTDEKTGEPVGQEQPMVLTPDVLNAYVGQVSNPEHWNAWTKDWHGLAQEDREYQEVTKPKEEQAMRTDRAREEALYAGADADRASAAADRRGGPASLKQSDLDRAHSAFMESQELRGLEDERLAQALASDMSDLYAQLGGRLQYPQIIDLVMGVHNGEHTLREGLTDLGIDVGQ